jgi:SET domain
VPRVEARSSRIAGRGLFAAEPVAGGSVALRQHGVGDLNHSCDPNLGWADDSTLVALRDITEDDELTVDYATAMCDPDFVMMCHCETYRCRQVIEGTDWRIPQLQKRYAGWFAPSVQRKIDEADRS